MRGPDRLCTPYRLIAFSYCAVRTKPEHYCCKSPKHHAARSHKGLAGIDRPNVGPWQLSLAKAARRCHFKLREFGDSRTDGPGSPAPPDKDSFWPISQSMPHRLRRDRARPAHPSWDMSRPGALRRVPAPRRRRLISPASTRSSARRWRRSTGRCWCWPAPAPARRGC